MHRQEGSEGGGAKRDQWLIWRDRAHTEEDQGDDAQANDRVEEAQEQQIAISKPKDRRGDQIIERRLVEFIAHRLNRKRRWEALIRQPFEIRLIIVAHLQIGKSLPCGDVGDVVVVRWFIGILPGWRRHREEDGEGEVDNE